MYMYMHVHIHVRIHTNIGHLDMPSLENWDGGLKIFAASHFSPHTKHPTHIYAYMYMFQLAVYIWPGLGHSDSPNQRQGSASRKSRPISQLTEVVIPPVFERPTT